MTEASRYRRVKQEAAEAAAAEKRRRAEADPHNEQLARQAQQAEEVAQAVRERVAARQGADATGGGDPAPEEQGEGRQLQGSVWPTRIALLWLRRLIPSRRGCWDRCCSKANGWVERSNLLMDAGFFSGQALETALEEGVEDVLCPEGSSPRAGLSFGDTLMAS